jgi:hypothetical protein
MPFSITTLQRTGMTLIAKVFDKNTQLGPDIAMTESTNVDGLYYNTSPINTSVYGTKDVVVLIFEGNTVLGASSERFIDGKLAEDFISDEIALVPTAVWASGTRTLTSFGTLVADIWSNATRTLTAISDSAGVTTLLSRISSALTIVGGAVTVGTNNDKTGYTLTVTPPTAAEIDAELTANHGSGTWQQGSTFNPATDTVARVTLVDTTTTNTDMRGTDNALLAASYTAPNNAAIVANGVAIAAIPTNPLLTTDGRLNNLDATISSRLASASYTAPDNTSITNALDALTLLLKYNDNDTVFLDADNATETTQPLAYFMVVFDNDGVTRLKTIAFQDAVGDPATLTNATKYTEI